MNSIKSLALDVETVQTNTVSNAEKLFDDHFDAVFRFLSRRVGNREDAQDLAAETFAAALTHACPRKVAPRCWLYGIARRKLADARRKRRLTVQLDDTLCATANIDADLQLRQWVDSLPSDQREALLLQALEDLSIEEIAHVMHRSRGSVKALLQRAKDRMRSEFNPKETQ